MNELPIELLDLTFLALVVKVGVNATLELRYVCRQWAAHLPIVLLRDTPTELLCQRGSDKFLRHKFVTFLSLRAFRKPYPVGAPGQLFHIIRRVVNYLHSRETDDYPRYGVILYTCHVLSEKFLHAYISATRSTPTRLLPRLDQLRVEEIAVVVAAYMGRDHLLRAMTVPGLVFRRIAGLACPLTLAIQIRRVSTVEQLLSLVLPDATQKPPRWLANRLDSEIHEAYDEQSFDVMGYLIRFRLSWRQPGPPPYIVCNWIFMAAFASGYNPALLHHICDYLQQRSSRVLTSYAVALLFAGDKLGSLRLVRALLESGLLVVQRKYFWLPRQQSVPIHLDQLERAACRHNERSYVLDKAIAEGYAKVAVLLRQRKASRRRI